MIENPPPEPDVSSPPEAPRDHFDHLLRKKRSNGLVVLLLEDEPLIAIDVDLTLGDAGYDVSSVTSCHDAGVWLDKHRPDVVVADINLRDGPCMDVVLRLVDADIPFVIFSGDHPSRYLNGPFMHGAWVIKPASPKDLLRAVNAALGSKVATIERRAAQPLADPADRY